MTTLDASSQSPRSTLVAEIQQRLDHETFPRLIVLIMLTVAGAGAFLCSAVALDAGIESMAGRYALATSSGYLVFLLLIRVWIGVRRGWFPDEADACDLAETARDVGRVIETSPSSGESVVDAASHGFDWSFDLDELWWLALIVLVAAAGLITVALVVYSAPILLAEVALDAALVGTVYRRLRNEERGYWATTALRRTWVSAAVLVTFMAVAGFALQQSTPDAVSIGDVVRRVLAR
jgi:hypothetical protein